MVVGVVVTAAAAAAVAEYGRWADNDDKEGEEVEECLEEWTRRACAMAMVDRGVVLECAAPLIWLSESAKQSIVVLEPVLLVEVKVFRRMLVLVLVCAEAI